MQQQYFYGMRLRGCSPGAQPKGFIERRDDPLERYHDILVYPRRLTDDELRDHELDFLGPTSDSVVVDDLLPEEEIPPEAWIDIDPNEVIPSRFHIDEWPVT